MNVLWRPVIGGFSCLAGMPAFASPACGVLNHLAMIDANAVQFIEATSDTARSEAIARTEEFLGEISVFDLVSGDVKSDRVEIERFIATRQNLVDNYHAAGAANAIATGQSKSFLEARDSLTMMRRAKKCSVRPQSEWTGTFGNGRDLSTGPEAINMPVKLSFGLAALALAFGAHRMHRHMKLVRVRQRRRAERFVCKYESAVRIAGVEQSGVICDASQLGIKMRVAKPCNKGADVTVLVGKAWLAGAVRWTTPHYIGVEFDRPLKAAEMAVITAQTRWSMWRLG